MGSKAGARRARQLVHQNVTINVPEPIAEGSNVTAHLGPTNSGKTFDATRALVAAGSGVYAAPLRMLAAEAWRTISDLAGPQNVGLITGEERINPDAPIICATTEMAPLHGNTLVLDEAHWAADATRGYAWTRLMTQGQYTDVHVIASPDAVGMLRNIYPTMTVVAHQRLGPLDWCGTVDFRLMQKGDAAVSYSRRNVLQVARTLAAQYGADNVAVLYGMMPHRTRQTQIEKVLCGEAHVVSCTDVAGHGLNLPLRRVLFTQTEKWDGEEVRDLHAWEAAQMAGRAGRAGLYPSGESGVLGGLPGTSPKPWVALAGLRPDTPLGDGLVGFEPVTHARLRPDLADLHIDDPLMLPVAVDGWALAAAQTLENHAWVTAEDVRQLRSRALVVAQTLQASGSTLSIEDAWTLTQSPLDPEVPDDRKLLGRLTTSIATRQYLDGFLRGPGAVKKLDLDTAEIVARTATVLRWSSLRFGESTTGVRYDDATAMEHHAADRVNVTLQQDLQDAARQEPASRGRRGRRTQLQPAAAA
jgi:ATP-dependent RNA helicase SUPV3L1/SUV3